MDVLTINSYAGSLVLGAKAAGLPIRGSYEDSGYGIAAQKLNFPDLRYVDNLPWPEDDLSGTIVLAHPPCAAFSNMNIVKAKRGLGTDAFECHRRVMTYAMGNGCQALAIESVTGALKAAAGAYGDYALRYGYGHCFLLLNAIDFGCPQWRPRFWVLFFREGKHFTFDLDPRRVNVQSILTGEAATDPVTTKHVAYLKKKYEKASFSFEEMMRSETQGGFDKVAKEFLRVEDMDEVKRLTGTHGLYRAGLPRKLDPTLWAPVVLGFSLWYVDDRPLNRVEYQRIMGFPDDFRWPEKMEKDFLTYLSKGVCPPVADWIVTQLRLNVERSVKAGMPTHVVDDGMVLDLQPEKKKVEQQLRGVTHAGL